MTREEMWIKFEKQLIRETRISMTMSFDEVERTTILGIKETVAKWKDRLEAENDEILNEAWHLMQNATEEDGVSTEQANGMLKLMAFFLYKYHDQKKPEWVESVEARLANPMAKEYKMHPIKDGFPKESGIYLVQDSNENIWSAVYDEDQEDPEERFGDWIQYYDPHTLGAIDSEWSAYDDIVAWCERPELYEEDDQEHESEADKMKEVGEWFAQGIEKGLKSTEEENK